MSGAEGDVDAGYEDDLDDEPDGDLDEGYDEDDLDDEPDDVASLPAAPTTYYPSVDVFVSAWLTQTYRRHLSNRARIWCPQWWRHGEAIARLEALWRAWEDLRRDPGTGMSVWFRDHADVHMRVLMDPEGPFRGCRVDEGHVAELAPLPLDEPPEGTFAAEDPA